MTFVARQFGFGGENVHEKIESFISRPEILQAWSELQRSTRHFSSAQEFGHYHNGRALKFFEKAKSKSPQQKSSKKVQTIADYRPGFLVTFIKFATQAGNIWAGEKITWVHFEKIVFLTQFFDFVLISPHPSRQSRKRLAKKLRTALEEHGVTLEKSPSPIPSASAAHVSLSFNAVPTSNRNLGNIERASVRAMNDAGQDGQALAATSSSAFFIRSKFAR